MARMSARRGASLSMLVSILLLLLLLISSSSPSPSPLSLLDSMEVARAPAPSKRVPGSAKLDKFDTDRQLPSKNRFGSELAALAANTWEAYRGLAVAVFVDDASDDDKILRAENRPVDKEEDRSMIVVSNVVALVSNQNRTFF